MALSLILSIIAGILSAMCVLTTIREMVARICAAIRNQPYYWEGNGINTIVYITAIFLWVIVAHLN